MKSLRFLRPCLARHYNSPAEPAAPSALFVPGKFCTKVTPPVIPHFDLSSLDVETMRANLRSRKIDPAKFPLLDNLAAAGAELKSLDGELETADAKLTELRERLKQREGGAVFESEDRDEMYSWRSLDRELTARKWELEETCVAEYLRLPNRLHPDTPLEENLVIHEVVGENVFGEDAEPHTSLCCDQLTFTDHGVYIEGDLALLELEVGAMAQDILLERGLEMVLAPDMTRSYILEGVHPGCDVVASGAADVAYAIAATSDIGGHDSAMGAHLVGSASLYPFLGQLSKNIVSKSELLPLRQFSIGRKYVPGSTGASLFEVAQTNCAEVFTASKDQHQMESQFEGLVEAMREFYDGIGIPYQLVIANAASLSDAQSKKVCALVHAHGDRKVVVGQVALYDHYLSKRLMLMSSCDGNNLDKCTPLYIAAGTMVDATKMVGCLVEHLPQEWRNKIPRVCY